MYICMYEVVCSTMIHCAVLFKIHTAYEQKEQALGQGMKVKMAGFASRGHAKTLKLIVMDIAVPSTHRRSGNFGLTTLD